MASAWRVVAFFLIVFVVPVILIALPLYARYTLYPVRSLELVADDTFDLHQLVSTFWCQGQRMSSNGTFDAYLLPRAPTLSRKRRKVTTVSKILGITEIEPEVRMVHLLKGSSFTFGVCARWPGGTVIVVRGEKNFDKCFYKEDIDPHDAKQLPDRKHRNPIYNPSKGRVEDGARPVPQVTRRPKVKGILPISEVDLVSEADNDGREVFDEDEDVSGTIILVNAGTVAADNYRVETTTIRLLDTTSTHNASSSVTNDVRYSTKTTLEPTTTKRFQNPSTGLKNLPSPRSELRSNKSKQNKKKRNRNKNRNKKLQEELPADNFDHEEPPTRGTSDNFDSSSRLLRVLRSIISEPDSADGSDEHLKREEEEARILGLLHSVNDTRDVTASNSSISSSEEFMEHCVDTILTVDVNVLVDCQAQDVSEGQKWYYQINDTDEYYFIFMSDNSIEENVMKFYLKLDRVMYNVSENTDVCNNSTECSFRLGFLGSEAVVVEMLESNEGQIMSDFNRYELQAVCQPRVAVYMVFILMVPFIILLFAFQ